MQPPKRSSHDAIAAETAANFRPRRRLSAADAGHCSGWNTRFSAFVVDLKSTARAFQSTRFMNHRTPLVLLALCVSLPLAAQTTNAPQSDQAAATSSDLSGLNGTVHGDIYTSPNGLYQIRIPVLPQLGGTIADTPNVVTFHDDFNTHITIGAFPLSPELKWEDHTRGRKDFLIYFFTSLVMPDFVKRFPGSTIEDNGLYLPKFEDGAMLIYTLLPGGSFFANRVTLFPRSKPLVAKRGNLCFVRNGYIFIISQELASHVLDPSITHLTSADEDRILRKRLVDLVRQMKFFKPKEDMN